MSDTALEIALDSTSTFESLLPYRDQLAAAPDGGEVALSADVADDTPGAVLFSLGQLLCAAVRDGKVKSDAVASLKEIGPFGAMCTTTGFDQILAPAA